MTLTLSAAALETVMLVSVRFIAFFVIAPPFSSRSFPATVKMMLALGLALAVAPTVGPVEPAQSLGLYMMDLGLQVVIGASLGFLVYLVFAAVESAGGMIDMTGGFAMAAGFDPLNQVNGAQMYRLFQMTALVLLFASNGHHLIVGGLIRSFEFAPLGEGISMERVGSTVAGGLTDLFLAAVQIAGPLIVVLVLADIGMGLLSRVAPALNVFVLSFPLKIYLTISLVSVVYLTLPRMIEALTNASLENIWGVIR
ncbi:flagellar biosynthetic protein FliR [Jonesia quinghaiensis]|uniref:flagellar biosynthetic protein FliR n=1 Tax=Jonesia quinghaiensis TaxID=262806 RepID=UPI0004020797|nr:flagellar biosynthetic protein FliR [Jonesia quinghaiensis]